MKNTDPLTTSTQTLTESTQTSPIDSQTNNKRKTSGIWLAALFFGIIFVAIVGANFFIAQAMADDATIANVAGRQRMLSQRIAKSLSAIDISLSENNYSGAMKAQDELKDSYDTFKATLSGFRDGGKTTDAAGNSFELESVDDKELHQHVVDASEIWTSLEPGILYASTDKAHNLDVSRVSQANQKVSQNNIALLSHMNALTIGLEKNTKSRFVILEIIQGTALLLVILTFAYIIKIAINTMRTAESLEVTQLELNQSNSKLNQTLTSFKQKTHEAETRAEELQDITINLNRLREESDTIFNSVDHGLCLLDSEFKIGSKISQSTYDIFETDYLSGLSFLDLMRPLITEKDLKTLENFLGLQFQGQTLDTQLEKFNPLKKIEITLDWDGDEFNKKHLGFEFERVYDEDDIIAVLVTITDVTETVALENELKRAGEEQARKTDLILEIVSSDSSELELFLVKTDKALNEINDTLKNRGVENNSSESNKDLVEDVFRIVHNIKGNASMLGLETVVELTHTVEDKLTNLRGRNNVKGEEFLAALVQLATLRERLTDYEDIIQTILKDFASSKNSKNTARPQTQKEKFAAEISKFNSEVATELNKQVYTRCDVDVDSMSDNGLSAIKDIIIQVTRNSIVHGIEKASIRKSVGKLEEGLISVLCELDESSNNVLKEPAYKFTFRDDGAGLDINMIREKAVSSGLKTKAEAKALSDAEIAGLIFQPSFSTIDKADKHAGRGTGMDIIKDKIVNTLKGKVSMSFSKGNYMQLNCLIPKDALTS